MAATLAKLRLSKVWLGTKQALYLLLFIFFFCSFFFAGVSAGLCIREFTLSICQENLCYVQIYSFTSLTMIGIFNNRSSTLI
jgi:hypothetical protein